MIADSSKRVTALHPPDPLELLEFGLAATMRLLHPVSLRNAPRSPDGGAIADYHGAIDDLAGVAALLGATPGVVEHGLFPPALVADVFVTRGDSVEHLNHAKPRP